MPGHFWLISGHQGRTAKKRLDMSKFPWKATLAASVLLAATAYAFAQMSPEDSMGMHGQMRQGGAMDQMHLPMMQGQGGMRGSTEGHCGMHAAQSGGTGTPI